MELKLIEPSMELEKQYEEYITEWEKSGEKIVPAASKRASKSYKEVLEAWKEGKSDRAYEKGFVPASLYFLADENMKIYGAIHIRHELNDYLLRFGGHIGYGIRPSERRKGYASLMLSLALPIARELGIEKALITCDKNNLGSAGTITKNGGILENEIVEDDELVQRYWVDIDGRL